MKKIAYFLYLISMCFASAAHADAAEDKIDPLELCPQIYLSDSAYKGTVNECKKLWDYYAAENSYCGMALMTWAGLGGQKASVANAKKYAEKLENTEPDECTTARECGCSRDNFLNIMNDWVKDNAQSSPSYLDLRGGVDTGHNISLLYYIYRFEIKSYQVRRALNPLVRHLSKEEQKAFLNVWVDFQNFLSHVDLAIPLNPCEIGNVDGLDYATPAKEKMLKDFEKSMKNLLANQALLLNNSAANDKDLSNSYKKLLEKQYFTMGNGDSSAKDLMAFENAWIKYRISYLHFVEIFARKQHNYSQIRKAVYAALTQKQLSLLRHWLLLSSKSDSHSPCLG